MPNEGTTIEGMATKRFRLVSWDQVNDEKVMKFRGKEVKHGWVKFVDENNEHGWCFEDGYRRYQHGQVIELTDSVKLAEYLEDGIAVPCEPPLPKKIDNSKERGRYRFFEQVCTGDRGTFEVDRDYFLPLNVGRKWEEKGLAVQVAENESRPVPDRKKA